MEVNDVVEGLKTNTMYLGKAYFIKYAFHLQFVSFLPLGFVLGFRVVDGKITVKPNHNG